MQEEVRKVTIKENLCNYAANIVQGTRDAAEVFVGASPRALLALLRCAQAIAYTSDRDYCIPEDIADSAKLTLPHRLILTPEAKMSHTTKADIVNSLLLKVKVP